MAFEPLKTDEKLDAPAKRTKDLDDQMIMGCSGFLVSAVGGYLLSVWPFFAWQKAELLSVLLQASAAGFVPAAAVGIVVSRKYGLPGACGAVGSALCTGIFLYLRIQQTFLEAAAQRIAPPDYPHSFIWILPGAWILAMALLCLLVMKPETADPA